MTNHTVDATLTPLASVRQQEFIRSLAKKLDDSATGAPNLDVIVGVPNDQLSALTLDQASFLIQTLSHRLVQKDTSGTPGCYRKLASGATVAVYANGATRILDANDETGADNEDDFEEDFLSEESDRPIVLFSQMSLQSQIDALESGGPWDHEEDPWY